MTFIPFISKRRALLLLVAVAPCFLIPANGRTTEREGTPVNGGDSISVVRRVTELYEKGDISRAENLAFRALDNPSKLTGFDRFELHRILAFCAIANDDEQRGVSQFVAALQLNPFMKPDPITWSPKIRRIFQQAVKEYKQGLTREKLNRRSREADICRSASWRSLYFPGAGQLYKKHKAKGYIVSTLFWGATATFVYSQFALPAAREDYRSSVSSEEAVDRWRDYRDIQHVAYISGGIAVAVYAFAFFDALWKSPEIEEQHPEP